jgi:hypothetical protein
VPRLTGSQIITRLAQMVAMLHDDETLVEFPRGPYLPLDAQRVGGGLYLLAVSAPDRALLGARLLLVLNGLDVLPAMNDRDSSSAAHVALRWVPVSPAGASTDAGLT